jgi:hypothetical protein
MVQKLTLEGTKIAQAAKDLNVTTATIRRYVTGMEGLLAVRQLKEDGLTNAQVFEVLAEKRKSYPAKEAQTMDDINNEANGDGTGTAVTAVSANAELSTGETESANNEITSTLESDDIDADRSEDKVGEDGEPEDKQDDRPKHALTCQTCSKSFEHSNPRLRDCLDCYRSKRKERRRGGSKHKNVILHPLAQQAANNNAAIENGTATNGHTEPAQTNSITGNGRALSEVAEPKPFTAVRSTSTAVRNYRKAIEETRQITSSLKRRLERPDLPEAERRWLEQVYAYQLILYQGWRHLSEYKTAVPE